MIEEHAIGPARLVVAIGTGFSLCAHVRIITGMAAVTTGLQRHVEYRLDMAGRAVGGRMAAKKLMACIPSVIEDAVGPFRCGVAGITVATKVAVVIVVVLVTSDAGGFEFVCEWIFAVAVTTTQFRVAAVEHETCIAGMVE